MRRDALAIYRAAIKAADPEPPLRTALTALPAASRRLWVFAAGKAAGPMAATAARVALEQKRALAGGLVVAPEAMAPPAPWMKIAVGDHPVPDDGSAAAAAALGAVVERVGPGDEVWVLLSGGATSLLAAPIEGLPAPDYRICLRELYRSGLPIEELNLVRKRLSRWAAGRLGAALGEAETRVFAVSDVAGDDPAVIGSGPCTPDPSTAGEVLDLVQARGLWTRLPQSCLTWLEEAARGGHPETPKPRSGLDRIGFQVLACNATALTGAAREAQALGYEVTIEAEGLSGEAVEAGLRIGAQLRGCPHGRCTIWGGETIVTLAPEATAGLGGRCQELALATAQELAGTRNRLLLAAGTDGRDGPTDAAGAVVDGETWSRIRKQGKDPQAALREHHSYPALREAGALLITGATGTNVRDIAIGLRLRRDPA